MNYVDYDGRLWGMPAALTGLVVGAVSSGVMQMVFNAVDGKPLTDGILLAMGSGATAGFVAGAILSGDLGTASVGLILTAGAAGSVTGHAVTMAFDDKKRTVFQGTAELAVQGTIGAVTSVAGVKIRIKTKARFKIKADQKITKMHIDLKKEFMGCPPNSQEALAILRVEAFNKRRIIEEAVQQANFISSLVGITEGGTSPIVSKKSMEIVDDFK